MFHKVLIANRGEIAVRIIRACRDLDVVPAVVYSDADRASLHVRLADEAYLLGPALSSESYLNIGRVIDAAKSAGADAIHPGYGFLSENADFATACAEAGIVLIGPPVESFGLTSDKSQARVFARGLDIPIVPGTCAPLTSSEEAVREARSLGYPVLLKAVAGGGGKGVRLVQNESGMQAAYEIAGSETRSAFGDASLYLEKYIAEPHHIEVQVLADQIGNAICLGERECSLQRRNQKMLEESPSPFLDETLRRAMGDAALRVVRSSGCTGAVTVEFLVDAERHFYFLDMNARLEVGHPVTEAVTGLDLVCEQLRIASGIPLTLGKERVPVRGWALGCRICAEDPDHALAPSPGVIRSLREPQGPGVRLDSGIYRGWEVALHYDSMLTNLTTFGNDRAMAIARMHRALGEYRIAGIKTNLPIFAEVLSTPEFLAGDIRVGLFEEVQRRFEKTRAVSPSLFKAHALAAALAYADATDSLFHAQDEEKESSWKLSGRPGFLAAFRR